VSKARSGKLITHPYPNFLFRIPLRTPSFPPVAFEKRAPNTGATLLRGTQPGNTSRPAGVGRNVGRVCANGAGNDGRARHGMFLFPQIGPRSPDQRIDFGEGRMRISLWNRIQRLAVPKACSEVLTERLSVRILFEEANISTSNSLALLVSGQTAEDLLEMANAAGKLLSQAC
jgi:hypothetical protein